MRQNRKFLSCITLLMLSLSACTISAPKILPPTPPIPTDESIQVPTPAPTATRLPEQITALSGPVLSLTCDPHNPAGLYALLATNDLYYSVDRGNTWKRLPIPTSPLRYDADIQTRCPPPMQYDIRPSETNPGVLWVRAGQTLFRSEDGGNSWKSQLDNVSTWTASLDGERLFALRSSLTTGIDGLYSSQDGGKNWELVFTGLLPEIAPSSLKPRRPGCVALALGPDEQSLYIGGPGGIYRSFDRGATWGAFNEGLPVDPEEINEVRLIVSDGQQTLYVLFGVGEDEEAAAHMIRLVQGENNPDQDRWRAIGADMLARVAHPEAVSFFGLYALVPGEHVNGQLYLGSEEGALLSQDFGETWMPIELPVAGRITRIAPSFGEGMLIYVWTGDRLLIHELPGSR